MQEEKQSASPMVGGLVCCFAASNGVCVLRSGPSVNYDPAAMRRHATCHPSLQSRLGARVSVCIQNCATDSSPVWLKAKTEKRAALFEKEQPRV